MESAAQQGNIDCLYEMIRYNPHVLEQIDSEPFVQTPMHVAACEGHVQFASEMMRLKPSFAWKFNPEGRRPVHLALENGHTTMVLHLIKKDKELVRAERREGLTLLHLASQSGDINLLTVFLKACPDSVKDLTARGETALHVALKHGNFAAFKFLVRWLRTNTVELQTILNERDIDGNTILHIAATNNDTQAMKFLIEEMSDLDAENLVGQRASDIINDEKIRNKLVGAAKLNRMSRKAHSLMVSMKKWLTQNTGMSWKVSDETRNMYLVVATLIATATYQAALSPPGGFQQIDSAGTNNTVVPGHGASNSSEVFEGISVMSKEDFTAFSSTNLCAFTTSILTIILLMPTTVVWFPLFLSSWLLGISYSFSLQVISPDDIAMRQTYIVWRILYKLSVIIIGSYFLCSRVISSRTIFSWKIIISLEISFIFFVLLLVLPHWFFSISYNTVW